LLRGVVEMVRTFNLEVVNEPWIPVFKCDAPGSFGKKAGPGAGPVREEINDPIVAPPAQERGEPPGGFPGIRQDGAQMGVILQKRGEFGINQKINLRLREQSAQGSQGRRSQHNVAHALKVYGQDAFWIHENHPENRDIINDSPSLDLCAFWSILRTGSEI
jgi:hypothetical protein